MLAVLCIGGSGGMGFVVTHQPSTANPRNHAGVPEASPSRPVSPGLVRVGPVRLDSGGDPVLSTQLQASDFMAVSCPTSSVCFGLATVNDIGDEDDAVVVESTDGGEDWGSPSDVPIDSPVALSCSSSEDCSALGADGTFASTTDGGSDWSTEWT